MDPYEKQVEIELNNVRDRMDTAKMNIRNKVSDKLADNPQHRWDAPVIEMANEVINKQ